MAAGSYGTWKADLAAQGRAAGIGLCVRRASRFASGGYRDHSSAAERDQSLAKLTYAPDADSKLMFIANGFSQQAQDPQGHDLEARYHEPPRSVEESALLYNTRKSISIRCRVASVTNGVSARMSSS
jgi:iron complex outermembrane receptor protein